MSKQENTELLERAREMIEVHQGTLLARQMELQIHMSNLEALRKTVALAEVLNHEYEVTDHE